MQAFGEENNFSGNLYLQLGYANLQPKDMHLQLEDTYLQTGDKDCFRKSCVFCPGFRKSAGLSGQL